MARRSRVRIFHFRDNFLTSACWATFVFALFSLNIPLNAQGQQPDALPTATDSASDADAERQKLFEELNREATLFERQGNLLKKAARFVTPSVVHIDAEKNAVETSRPQGAKPVEEAGSGVIISYKDRYYILTNRHVISNSSLDNITITLFDGRTVKAARAWADNATDVAVIAVAPTPHKLIPARMGDSNKVETGDFVLAVGSPFGLSHSVTNGIISATGRRDLQLGDGEIRYQDFFQTDASINPGNSGGPLVNMRGEVIGLNTAIASATGHNEGIGFAIPIKMAIFAAHQLIDRGGVERAYIGVQLDSRFNADAALRLGLPRPQGARISGVTRDSPAQAAHLQVGDVILEFGDVGIEDDNHLINAVSVTPIGEEVQLVVFRNGQRFRTNITLGRRSNYE